MAPPPDCKRIGRQCREIDLTVWIGDYDEESKTEVDYKGTWILGHTQRVTFGDPYKVGSQLLVDATFHVPCKFLRVKEGRARCKAFDFEGRVPVSTRPGEQRQLAFGDEWFEIVYKRKRRKLKLPLKKSAQKQAAKDKKNKKKNKKNGVDNPCMGAHCRTPDNTRGDACCRDLRISLELPERKEAKEALLRTRKSPYLCKAERTDETTVEVDLVSACGYLNDDGTGCTLHDRLRPNGRSAKPQLCYDWPILEKGEYGHPGCALLSEKRWAQ